MASVLLTLVPDRPSSGVDNSAHAGLLECNTGVFSPGSAKVVGTVGDVVAGSSGDVAVVEDIVGRVGVRVSAVGYVR